MAGADGRIDRGRRQQGRRSPFFETRLDAVAEAVASGPDSPIKPTTVPDALVALASLIGAVTLARALADVPMAAGIAKGMERQLLG